MSDSEIKKAFVLCIKCGYISCDKVAPEGNRFTRAFWRIYVNYLSPQDYMLVCKFIDEVEAIKGR